MLEYTLEFENKLRDAAAFDPSTTVMMFCSNGFDWHEDELEDFVAFYVDGRHRQDDALASMERHSIEVRSLQLPRQIRRFGYLQRNNHALEASVVNWDVRPPVFPACFGTEAAEVISRAAADA